MTLKYRTTLEHILTSSYLYNKFNPSRKVKNFLFHCLFICTSIYIFVFFYKIILDVHSRPIKYISILILISAISCLSYIYFRFPIWYSVFIILKDSTTFPINTLIIEDKKLILIHDDIHKEIEFNKISYLYTTSNDIYILEDNFESFASIPFEAFIDEQSKDTFLYKLNNETLIESISL